jgi:hypothetical protein
VPKEQLERAKLAAISSVYMNLESRAVVAEDIGRQILTYGHRCARASIRIRSLPQMPECKHGNRDAGVYAGFIRAGIGWLCSFGSLHACLTLCKFLSALSWHRGIAPVFEIKYSLDD